MFSGRPKPDADAKRVADYFGGSQHGSHGRRINRYEARQQKLNVVDIEGNQQLQDCVLTLYHLSTIGFELTTAAKMVVSSNGHLWIKYQMGGSRPATTQVRPKHQASVSVSAEEG